MTSFTAISRFRPRHLLIRWLLPLTWKASANHQARVLQEFAQTELDSAWQSLFALERVTDPKIRALLIRHAFEERFHADLFLRLVQDKYPMTQTFPLTRRKPLLPLDRPTSKASIEFMAFLAIGESEINEDFSIYEQSLPDRDVRRVFKIIAKDEMWHAHDSADALSQLSKEHGVSLSLMRLRHMLRLAGRRYTSLADKFGGFLMGLLLGLVYYSLGFIFFRQARERMSMRPERQLELFREQQREADRKIGAIR